MKSNIKISLEPIREQNKRQDKLKESQEYVNEEGTPEEEHEGDEMLDDNYIIQLHQYLQEMKRQRKEAEQNTNLLNGRLRCLRDEEQKTLKKIEVTRKKRGTKSRRKERRTKTRRKKR